MAMTPQSWSAEAKRRMYTLFKRARLGPERRALHVATRPVIGTELAQAARRVLLPSGPRDALSALNLGFMVSISLECDAVHTALGVPFLALVHLLRTLDGTCALPLGRGGPRFKEVRVVARGGWALGQGALHCEDGNQHAP
eukprot:CAMPEP_0174303984 /NCGR_PEP_ID=MMETSP0809-20121228/60511_1 /TAXON_ID=73025 ORGANISM="Eutreptiella gymnastica-like, Strain CCMP1594" /NCGR_SAMPLE_ID=MMETSP0809 /ASSEMBLY_ACC=CAM_ASM_000658 /LENGTH=140 /DNA_ID=CAMNT_0015410113 /DNA_START=712 /DNA_END=1134 /DNA_ORIENTATION=+